MAVTSSLDISWQANHKRKGKPIGFKNLGNTCYLNSVLQCLTYTPPLANFCIRGQHARQCDSNNLACPFCLLETRIARSLCNDVQVDSPQRIYRCLQNFAKHFRPGRQEDAHELLRYAIDACDNVCVQLHKRSLKGSQSVQKEEVQTVMKEIFGGYFQNQIRCLSCNGESSKLDSFMDLSLDIMHTKTLKEAICKFFQSEVLDGNNKYHCEKCKKLSVARKQMSIYQAPNVLVIQLKRFENFLGGKIDSHIEFEDRLKLGNHVSKGSRDLQPDYSLYAVVVHSGYSQYGGHYYAYVKDPRGQWYCCNDAFVSVADSRAVLSERVYILFYVRDHPKPTDLKEGYSSASSTPSPPPTPDPVTVSKSPASKSCTLASTNKGQPTPKLKFSILKPDKPTLKLNVKPKANQGVTQSINMDETEANASVPEQLANSVSDTPVLMLPSTAMEKENQQKFQGTAHPDAFESGSCRSHKRKLESFEDRLKEFNESAAYEELKRRLENEGREFLKQSGWCDSVRESFRDAKKHRDKEEIVQDETCVREIRERLLRQVPVSVKEHLVRQLQTFYMTKIL